MPFLAGSLCCIEGFESDIRQEVEMDNSDRKHTKRGCAISAFLLIGCIVFFYSCVSDSVADTPIQAAEKAATIRASSRATLAVLPSDMPTLAESYKTELRPKVEHLARSVSQLELPRVYDLQLSDVHDSVWQGIERSRARTVKRIHRDIENIEPPSDTSTIHSKIVAALYSCALGADADMYYIEFFRAEDHKQMKSEIEKCLTALDTIQTWLQLEEAAAPSNKKVSSSPTSSSEQDTSSLSDSLVAAAVSATLEAMPTPTERIVEIIVTATPPTVVAPTLQTPPPTIIPIPTTMPERLSPFVASSANLRAGPGTNYAIVGGMPASSPLSITGRNESGDWYKLDDNSWIFAPLVSNAPDSLPIVEAPTPLPTRLTQSNTQVSGTIRVDHWRFEIDKVQIDPGIDLGRQSVILLGHIYNQGSQTDTFGARYRVILQDSKGRQYQKESRITWAAQDKYGADYAASISPEARRYIAIGYDVPASENSFTIVPGSLASSWSGNLSFSVP